MDEEDIQETGIRWEKPHFYYGSHLFIPRVYPLRSFDEAVPRGFSAVRIFLDGSIKSHLDWKAAAEAAKKYSEKGLLIFWEMDLGLFSKLDQSLADQTQYKSLCLSIEHFRDSLWKSFKNETLGLCIYKGSGDFSQGFPWDDGQKVNLQGWLQDIFGTIEAFSEETGISAQAFYQMGPYDLKQTEAGTRLLRLFCRDAAAEYFDLLTNRLPDSLPLFLLLNATSISSKLDQIRLFHQQRFERFHLAIKGSELPLSEMQWDGDIVQAVSTYADTAPTLGICLPDMSKNRASDYQTLEAAIEQIDDRKIPYRIIPEAFLTSDWDGLDFLIVLSNALSSQGVRKLQGFCAAGGTVITIGSKKGLPNEVPYSSWLTEFKGCN